MRNTLLLVVGMMCACSECGPKAPRKTALPEGEPCQQDSQCETGLCFALKGEGQKCGRPCSSGCNYEKQVCTQLGFQRYACVPLREGLCRACETNADCPYPGDACLNVGGQLVCGRDCSFDSTCPDGYRCSLGRDFSGNEVGSQCVPKSLTCECTPANFGMRITCESGGDGGVCSGTRVCDGSQYSKCSAQKPMPERCNGMDDDCNGQVDEGLGNTACGLGECQRTYSNCVNGQPQTCTPGVAGHEVCNGRDDDCDGVVDNSFDMSSPQMCGSCTNACKVEHGEAACVDGGTCAVGSCHAPFADCNGVYVDGCETDTASNVNHCGACNQACLFANAVPSCARSTCSFTCLPNFRDVNKDPSDGCEMGCDFVNPDLPDLAFGDSNCDGIDGDISAAIFVDTVTGNDGNDGTQVAPMKTLRAGIAAASAFTPKRHVYVSVGVYSEPVTLVEGVSLYGGYNAAAQWTRSVAFVTTIESPTTVGISAVGLTAATEVQLFTIASANAAPSTMDASGDGTSSYGVLVRDVTAPLYLRGLKIHPGNGSSGGIGAAAPMAAAGAKGGNANTTGRGAGGASMCGAVGGAGGQGREGAVAGIQGAAGTQAAGGGTPGTGGAAGAGGSCNTTNSSNGHPAPPPANGLGGAGPLGVNGSPGSAVGSFSRFGLYLPVAGGEGSNGFPGGGGGGGGSGGGTAHGHNFFCSNCAGHWGGGGGGGGGGGCGGIGGRGGYGGGGSFGIVVSQSPQVIVESTRVTTGNGGRGGTGGDGGRGGEGGRGGVGAAGQCHDDCSYRCGGRGADGAWGGPGGQGGAGAGGSGGPSICIVYSGEAPQTNDLHCGLGLAGEGGAGGQGGLSRAPEGSSGLSVVSLKVNTQS